ncbi:MAG: hypothetical protein PHR25_02615 [Clostridia bacterium]|nr:hypothetical protein [Clostridia bacterium]
MKTTDFAMIFIAILLPIVIVVYVDISFLLKAEEERLYYINVINSAIEDATYAMKTVEGEEQDVDYGYSGLSEKKIAINAKVAVDTFFESLYNNFDIKGDKINESYIKEYVPALAIVDYDGIYMYSINTYKNIVTNRESIGHVLKPKRYFSYTYGIENNNLITGEELINMGNNPRSTIKIITVQFTMDDYIVVVGEPDIQMRGFYIEDNRNNTILYNNRTSIREEVLQHLKIKRLQVISDIVSQEMSFAVNNHNFYSDLKYEFVFPTIAMSDWEQMIGKVGIIAFIQGIKVGNVKLNYVAHGISGLKLTDRYYVSKPFDERPELNYYHTTKDCPTYKSARHPLSGYYMNKMDAATTGYYPCPVCKP